MKVIVAFIACLVLVSAVADESFAAEQDCPAEAHAATAGCRAKVTTARALAKKACGGKDPDAVIAKLKRLKDLAKRQEDALKRGEEALAKMRAEAARLAKMSAAERGKLKAALLKQKGGQKGLSAAQKAAAADVQKWKELKSKAQAATSKAVTVARDTGDKVKIASAKSKAHKLYTRMVDEKVRVAAAHHKVITARAALAKLSKEVEKEIGVAKKTAGDEAVALKKVAKDRHTIAVAALKEAQAQYDAMKTKTNSASNIENGFKSNLKGAKGDLSSSKDTLKHAKHVEASAKKAESKIGAAKIKNKPLTMKAIREEAHKIAAGQKDMPSAHQAPKKSHTKTSSKKKVTLSRKQSPNGNAHVNVHVSKTKDKKVQVHSHGVSKHVHQKYADKVKALEKERLAAKAKYKAEESKLKTLKKDPHANKAEIASTQAAMRTAQSNVQKLAQAQQSAVENAVNLVTSNKP